MSVVIGCDYSASEAFFSIVKDELVIKDAKVKLSGDLPEQRLKYFEDLQAFFRKTGLEASTNLVLYMEESWVAQAHLVNAAIKLARNAAYIELAAITMGYLIRHVHVSTWREGVYGNGKPQNPKGTAIAWCLYNLGYETKNHNLAEAACISFYGGKDSQP